MAKCTVLKINLIKRSTQ